VSPDHDAIDELLAGYVLGALSGADAAEMDRLFVEHVPDCSTCRETLRVFQELTGDLGVSTDPLAPPDMLLPRLQRDLGPRRVRRMPSWSAGRIAATVAAVVVAVGVAGAVVGGNGGGSDSVLANADLSQIQTIKASPGSTTTENGEVEQVTPSDREETYVMGTSVPAPPAGMTYRLWAIGSDGAATYVGDFTPIDGVVALEIRLDPTTLEIRVTTEPIGSQPVTPGQPAWSAA
jgi:anti-sigma-K factor RskA